jgi:hypothetical protein
MFYSLPLIAETQFANYLSSCFTGTYQKQTPTGAVTGSYSVINAFAITPFEAPFILVSALKFKEKEPFTDVFRGELEVTITTQIDDAADPIGDHDQAVSQVYSLMRSDEALISVVNASNFHLWGYYNTDYQQGIGEGKEMGRCLTTRLEYMIECQNSGVSV